MVIFMTGYELRIWRKGLGWSRERTAEELGVSLRTYKDYETSDQVKKCIVLATFTLSVQNQLPVFEKNRTSGDKMRKLLSKMVKGVLSAP